MFMGDPTVEIVICLGSSCFARGNAENLDVTKKFIRAENSNAKVRLTARLCQDQCKEGPNVLINGTAHHQVTPAKMLQLLQQNLRPEKVHERA
jgi:NADH:ubiquinone oxidoreductase subunit E